MSWHCTANKLFKRSYNYTNNHVQIMNRLVYLPLQEQIFKSSQEVHHTMKITNLSISSPKQFGWDVKFSVQPQLRRRPQLDNFNQRVSSSIVKPLKMAEQDFTGLHFMLKIENIEYGFGRLLVNIIGSASMLGKHRIAFTFLVLICFKELSSCCSSCWSSLRFKGSSCSPMRCLKSLK